MTQKNIRYIQCGEPFSLLSFCPPVSSFQESSRMLLRIFCGSFWPKTSQRPHTGHRP
ncbi:uncharacterized protein BCR38DRAFT_428271 [Pseudomassariella vexata]|uniref:Uncharacterized protein n=1 Tax=Pseudomassariella vexata TaxID=1141098 RepID=A0A1Y2E8G8_9PEZI|nr:uncharacterized protein BCR38DRAFT_428271 [Pseudomassariella vexata]ORY67832.1 hypothetical protein BCR38DRAFT_428271 [Pseudomassariella vexata]